MIRLRAAVDRLLGRVGALLVTGSDESPSERSLAHAALLPSLVAAISLAYSQSAKGLFFVSVYGFLLAHLAARRTREETNLFQGRPLILLRMLSLLYVVTLFPRFNIPFALGGFLVVYEITRVVSRENVRRPVGTFALGAAQMGLSAPDSGGGIFTLLLLGFVFASVRFLDLAARRNHSPSFDPTPVANGVRTGPLEAARIVDLPGASARGATSHMRVMLLFTLLLGLSFFLLTPRLRLSVLAPIRYSGSGFSPTFGFQHINDLKKSDRPVMRVTLSRPGVYYYRAKSWNMYMPASREWQSMSGRFAHVEPDGDVFRVPETVAGLSCPSSVLTQDYQILTLPENTVVAVARPDVLDYPFTDMMIDLCDNLQIRGVTALTYSVESRIPEPAPERLDASPAEYPQMVTRMFTRFPRRELLNIGELARGVTKGHVTPYRKVVAIATYLEENCQYDLNVGTAFGGTDDSVDPNERFLFTVKRGHCEFFASTMTLMVQSLGIPARLTGGFVGGDRNETAGYVLVRGRNAHAWCEVFFAGLGWIQFDPTGYDPNAEIEDQGVLASILRQLDLLDYLVDSFLYSFLPSSLPRILAAVARVADRAFSAWESLSGRTRGVALFAALVALLLALLRTSPRFLLWAARLLSRSPILAGPLAALVIRNLSPLALLERVGAALVGARRPSETVIEYGDRAGSAGDCRPDAAQALPRLASLVSRGLYGIREYTPSERDELAGLAERLLAPDPRSNP